MHLQLRVPTPFPFLFEFLSKLGIPLRCIKFVKFSCLVFVASFRGLEKLFRYTAPVDQVVSVHPSQINYNGVAVEPRFSILYNHHLCSTWKSIRNRKHGAAPRVAFYFPLEPHFSLRRLRRLRLGLATLDFWLRSRTTTPSAPSLLGFIL